MNAFVNIAYVHSRLCDALCLAAEEAGAVDFDGFIYSRGYRGYHRSSIVMPEDYFTDELMMVALGFQFSRFLARFPDRQVRLFIPHYHSPLLRLFASHQRVTQVHYLEEGELSYLPDLRLHPIRRQPDGIPCSANAWRMMEAMGFDLSGVELVPRQPPLWFTDVFGKFAGTLASDPLAFQKLGGHQQVVPLPSLRLFERPVGLLLVTCDGELSEIVGQHLRERGLDAPPAVCYEATLEALARCFEVAVHSMQSLVSQIVVKPHPGLRAPAFQRIKAQAHVPFIEWSDTELDYQTRRHEIGRVNFSHIYSIGGSSVLRYAQSNAFPEQSCECLADADLIDLVSGIALESMQDAALLA